MGRLQVSTKLYAVVGLFSILIGSLCLVTIFASQRMGRAGTELHSSFLTVDALGRFRLMIERQRRIVDSAPAELERSRLKEQRQEFSNIVVQMQTMMENGVVLNNGGKPDADASRALGEMVRLGHEVISLAEKFAHDRAGAIAQGPYNQAAETLQGAVEKDQAERMTLSNEAATAVQETSRLSLLAVAIAGAGAMLLCPFGIWVTQRVVGRLALVRKAMMRLANGEQVIDIPGTEHADEVGAMAQALEVFRENLLQISELSDKAETVRSEAAETRRNDLNQIADEFEETVQRVAHSVAESSTSLQSVSRSLSEVASDTSSRAKVVLDQASETSDQIAAVVGATSHLNDSIGAIAESASLAATIAQKVGDDSLVIRERVSTLVAASARWMKWRKQSGPLPRRRTCLPSMRR
jgi:HAMP domain-containing protein